MKFLLIMLASTSIFAAPALTNSGAYEFDRSGPVNRKYYLGTKLFDAQQFGVKGQWSFDNQGGAAGGILNLEDHDGQKVTLPNNAIIRDCLIDVVEPVTAGAVTSARISFSASEVGDLRANNLIIAGSYNAQGRIACIPVGTVGTMIKLESEAAIHMRIGSEALTGGKINVWLEYTLSD